MTTNKPQRTTNVGDLSLCDPDLSVGSHRRYVRGHIWWLGLKYVSSQMAFCGLYVEILTSPLTGNKEIQVVFGTASGSSLRTISAENHNMA